jgi:hypothetical protein
MTEWLGLQCKGFGSYLRCNDYFSVQQHAAIC